ncbi:MAG: UDP-N-acetylmuramate-L-alanine ligase [Parcubacteria group bacterium GW2011_GWC1_38_22]|nr:MAG: UDP-N-acetylmuramate-L-alanine ligase [Parcubacteria group bacterium GW2011_GWC1_38_22]
MDIKDLKKIYCIGIKGAGMTAVAEILQSRGIAVSGSDTKEVFYTDEILKRLNIPVKEEFTESNIPDDCDLIVYSTAYNEDNNVEMKTAKASGVQMMSYPEMLGALFQEKLGIAVCGTHGKTTTTAMLAEAFSFAGKNPSAIVGSQVIAWQGSALAGDGEYFIAESDEYQNKLRFYQPWSAILTSVDWDHPDFFPDMTSYKEVFKTFVAKIPKIGYLVVWGDSADTIDVAKSATCQILTYGFGEDNLYRIMSHESRIMGNVAMQSFEVFYDEKSLGEFETPLSGKHNVLNSTAVIALSHAVGLDLEKIKIALAQVKGTSRRFETIGKFNDALLIFGDKKIWTVFHPHTFSRTKALLQDFAQSFDDTEHVVVIGTYGSAREQGGPASTQGGPASTQGGEASSEDLVKLINKYNHGKAEYIPTIDEAVEYFKEKSGQYDVLITMGAGDVWRVAEKLKNSSN